MPSPRSVWPIEHAPDAGGRSPTFHLSADTYLAPDVVVYPRTSGLEALSGPSVLLVVEIADSSLRYDSTSKAALYASFGVRELWVIDAVKRATRVRFWRVRSVDARVRTP